MEFIAEIIGEVVLEAVLGPLLRWLGSLLKYLFLFIISPYLLLRGWLHVRPRASGVWALYQQGKQAAAHDMQYVLSVVVALPLVALGSVGIWVGVKALLAWLA